MKYRDKLIKYFEEAPEGAVIVANDMYEKGFTKMSHDAFFRAVERLCDDGIIVRAGKGMYIKAEDKDKNQEALLLQPFHCQYVCTCLTGMLEHCRQACVSFGVRD